MADSISQADLDALLGDLGAEKAAGAEPGAFGSGSAGLSQADLDALWGSAPQEPAATPTAPAEGRASSGSENLSQDDIDKLLAEMGK